LYHASAKSYTHAAYAVYVDRNICDHHERSQLRTQSTSYLLSPLSQAALEPRDCLQCTGTQTQLDPWTNEWFCRDSKSIRSHSHLRRATLSTSWASVSIRLRILRRA